MHHEHTISPPSTRKVRRPEVGECFGRLVVIGPGVSRRKRSQRSKPYVPVRCECGTETEVLLYLLISGHTRSCGCLHLETIHGGTGFRHGEKGSRLYQSWNCMRTRCNNPNRIQSKDYIGRGIGHCPEWGRYENFRDWALANGYRDGLSLERRDVDGDYRPANCCWIPRQDQARNKRNSVRITAFGETKIVGDWARDPRCRVGWRGLYYRIERGWSPEEAIVTPSARDRG